MSNTSAKLRAARLLMLVLGAAGMLACRAAGEPRPGGATVAPHSEQLRSELTLSLALELGSGRAPQQITLRGTWLERAVACEAHARCLALRLEHAQVSAAQGADDGAARDLERLAQELQTPFLAAYGRDGSLGKVAFAPGTHETVQNLLQLIAAQLQVVAGPAQAEHWVATERDSSGEYLAAYHRAPGPSRELLKQKREYVRAGLAQAGGNPQGAASRVQVLESAARHTLDARGRRVGFEGRETLAVSLGPLAFTSSLELRLRNGKSGPAPDLTFDMARYAFRPVQQTELDGAQQLARTDRKVLGTATLHTLLAELSIGDASDAESRESLRRRLEALCRVEPSSCEALARETGKRKGADDVLLGALGMVQSEAAHAALLALAGDTSRDSSLRRAALRYLSRAELSDAHIERLGALLDDAEVHVRAAVRLAYGAVARAVRAQRPQSARKVAETLLARLASAREVEQVELVRALGNAGAAEASSPLLALARGSDAVLAREALNALRFVELPEVDAQLEASIRSAVDPLTRIAALEATRFRQSGALLPAIVEAARRDADPEVRRAALDQLGARLGETPRLREVLVEAAQDRDESVRRAAQRNLDPTEHG